MKNKYLYLLVFLYLIFFKDVNLFAGELEINSTNIKIEKNTRLVILEGNVEAKDENNNRVFTDKAKYNKSAKFLKTEGNTKIITSEGYIVTGKNITFDNSNKIISSEDDAQLIDTTGNIVNLKMFNYLVNKNLFFSKGEITVTDINKNFYKFSEVYIDEKKSKIVGSEAKIFLNDPSTKINSTSEPRLFSNTMTITKEESTMEKGVFTFCKNREGNKCPPWQIRAKKIKHSSSKKTIFYDDAVIKIYDFPIFYFPKFSHPDPTVKRRSGFLIPNYSDNSTVGSATSIPYFWSISNDKDLTITPKLYFTENPLLLTEYRQDFEKSFLILDAGYTPGYRKNTIKKTSGARAHLFSKFNINFKDEKTKNSNLELNLQHVSNSTYFKAHDINTSLVDEDVSILENRFDYDYQNEDLFFGATLSAFDTLGTEGNTKYEYLLPYLALDKNILTDEKYGLLDLNSKFRVRNYDVNKQTEFIVNDLKWKSHKNVNNFGVESQFQSLLKTVNYNANNTADYKNNNSVSELSGVIGYLSKLDFYKKNLATKTNHSFSPKLLLRYAPGHMRDLESGGDRLKYSNLYDINKVSPIDVIESGASASLGFNYKKSNLTKDKNIGDEIFSFSAGQAIRPKENMDIPSSTSLEQKFSDIVGETSLKVNELLDLNYTFAIDQSYREFNSNDVGADLSLGKTSFNINFLQEKNHIGNTENVKGEINYDLNEMNSLSFSTKRNLLTNSAEFYNLSYSYVNDCLKAGLVYKREFYSDRDVEDENSLMFTISLIPFANINTPNFKK